VNNEPLPREHEKPEKRSQRSEAGEAKREKRSGSARLGDERSKTAVKEPTLRLRVSDGRFCHICYRAPSLDPYLYPSPSPVSMTVMAQALALATTLWMALEKMASIFALRFAFLTSF